MVRLAVKQLRSCSRRTAGCRPVAPEVFRSPPSPVPRCHDGPRSLVSPVPRRSRRRRPPQPRPLPPPSPVPPLPSPGVRRRFNTRDREALTLAGWLRTSGSPRLALRRHRPLSSAPLCAVLLCPVFCSSSLLREPVARRAPLPALPGPTF